MLRANAHAIAASDTTLADDLGLAFGDANRLDRTLPHARIAHAAAFGDGSDECRTHATPSTRVTKLTHRVGHNVYGASGDFFSQGFTQKFGVKPFYGLVVMRDSDHFVGVDGIQGFHARPDRVGVGADGLAAAGDATAGASHHFDEMQVIASGPDLIEQAAGVAQSAYDGDARSNPSIETRASLTPSRPRTASTSSLSSSLPVTRK